jgi:putative hydrolase
LLGGDYVSIPFGFSPSDDPNQDLKQFFENLSSMMHSGSAQNTGPVDWNAAQQASAAELSKSSAAEVKDTFQHSAETATDLADLWLSEATALPSSGAKCLLLTREKWIAETLLAWQGLVDPVAHGLAKAMSTIIPQDIDAGDMSIPPEILEQLPPEVAQQIEQLISSGDIKDLLGPVMDMAKSMGATLFGNQFGHGLGTMATQVLSATDVGIPLSSSHNPSFIASNVQEFSDGLELEVSDVLIFLALRELAHQRLFTTAPWLQSHIQSAMAAYASGVQIDTSAIEQALAEIDPTDIEAVNSALSGELFVESRTPEQEAALARLELLIALIESWVSVVVSDAVANRLPSSDALAETLRRRRAAGGPAEKFFEGIIGLEIRPRKIREAVNVWRQLTEKLGIQQRDIIWTHPDLMPTSPDLEDIDLFIANMSHDLMPDLQKLIDEQPQIEQDDDVN